MVRVKKFHTRAHQSCRIVNQALANSAWIKGAISKLKFQSTNWPIYSNLICTERATQTKLAGAPCSHSPRVFHLDRERERAAWQGARDAAPGSSSRLCSAATPQTAWRRPRPSVRPPRAPTPAPAPTFTSHAGNVAKKASSLNLYISARSGAATGRKTFHPLILVSSLQSLLLTYENSWVYCVRCRGDQVCVSARRWERTRRRESRARVSARDARRTSLGDNKQRDPGHVYLR